MKDINKQLFYIFEFDFCEKDLSEKVIKENNLYYDIFLESHKNNLNTNKESHFYLINLKFIENEKRLINFVNVE